jgi:hypothetical protein
MLPLGPSQIRIAIYSLSLHQNILMKRLLFLLFLLPFVALGQGTPCVGCPSSLKGAKSSVPYSGFYGHTSEVSHFDGVRPRCFTPTANTLNGVIAGINNALCTANTRMDTLNILVEGDSIIQAYLDLILLELDSLYNTSLISSDGSVSLSVSTNYVTNVNTWDVTVDIDTLKAGIMEQLDFSCLGISTTNFDSAFQALIDLACEGCEPSSDSCSEWNLFSTASLSSSLFSFNVTATSYSVGPVPSGMCLNSLQYIYQVLDSNGVILPNGFGTINATPTLGTPTTITIPLSHLTGAATMNLISRFDKELCSSGAFCGLLDTLVTYVVPEVEFSPLVLNNDSMTIYWNGDCRTRNVYSNDIIPYTIASAGIYLNPSHGTATMNTTTGVITYCPDNGYNGYDTLSYFVTDIYGQTDTAYVIYNIINETSALGQICFTQFINSGSNDTIVLSFDIDSPDGGNQFAQQGILLDFDDYGVSQQLDDPAFINGSRNNVTGTVKIHVGELGTTLDTVVFTLQIVTADFLFYELEFEIPLSGCDTFELFPTTTTSFLYAKSGTQFCVGNATDYVQTTLSVSGAGIINADGSPYTNGVCIEYVEATASVTSPAPTNRNWIVTNMGANYKTTEIDSASVNKSATVTTGNTAYVQPHPTAYSHTISATGFDFTTYTWWTNINHSSTDRLFTTSIATNPQCFNQVGIITFTCGP